MATMNDFSAILNFLLFSTTLLLALFLSGNAVLILGGSAARQLPLDLRLPLAIILGLSLIPLILLWSSTFGLVLTPLFAFLYVAGAGLINLLALLRRQPAWPLFSGSIKDKWQQDPAFRATAWLGFILTLTWLTRFIAVQGFVVAPGADSYHHTLIATLIAEQGQIPTSYQPYAPPSSFTYHFGFHALTAWLYWLTGIPLPKLVLWVGQGLNALVVLAMYFFTKKVTDHTPTALIAAFLVGLVAVFPAYMVNWSRFTQLSGLVIVILALGVVTQTHLSRNSWPITALLAGSLCLYHYRVLAMLGLLLVIIGLVEIKTLLISTDRRRELARLLPLMGGVGVGLLLVTPWFIRLLLGSQIFELTRHIHQSTTRSDNLQYIYDFGRLGPAQYFYSNLWLILLSLAGLVAGWLMYRRTTFILTIWVLILLLISNPYWLALPGVGLVDLTTLLISSFVPVCFLAAIAIQWILEFIQKLFFKPAGLAWSQGLILAGFTLFAFVKMSAISRPDDVYLHSNDLQAMTWIETHLSPDAKFLINPVIFEYGQAFVTGNDAGYWLPLLTGRQTTIPPMVLRGERHPGNLFETSLQLAQVATNPAPSALKLLAQERITHIFIGERGGPIPVNVLESAPCTTVVWQRGRVKIFELNPTCLE